MTEGFQHLDACAASRPHRHHHGSGVLIPRRDVRDLADHLHAVIDRDLAEPWAGSPSHNIHCEVRPGQAANVRENLASEILHRIFVRIVTQGSDEQESEDALIRVASRCIRKAHRVGQDAQIILP